MTERVAKTEPGLIPRLIAAGWFAAAAFIPIAFFFASFARGGVSVGNSEGGSNLIGVWFFVVFPISTAAFFGFALGARIVDFERKRTSSRALLRGMLVAICSYLAMPASYISVVAFAARSEPFAKLAYWILLIFGVGALFVGWLVVIAGGVAGLLLFWASGNAGLQTLFETAPRVSRTKAYLLIAAAGGSILVINVLFLLQSASKQLFFLGIDRFDPVVGSLQSLTSSVLR